MTNLLEDGYNDLSNGVNDVLNWGYTRVIEVRNDLFNPMTPSPGTANSIY